MLLRAAVLALPVRQRQAVVARHYLGLSVEETARRRRRRMTVGMGSLLVMGSLIALAVQIPDSRDGRTVVAGPTSSRTIPIEVGTHTATVQIRLLDGTQVRLTLPAALGEALADTTFSDVELHGSLYENWGAQPSRGWRIDVAVGSIETLSPAANHLWCRRRPGAPPQEWTARQGPATGLFSSSARGRWW